MKIQTKTKEQLTNELEKMRQRVAKLEQVDAERKRAEDELHESEEKYRTVLETIEEGYYEVDLAGNFTFFNDSLCRILGYPPDELTGMSNRRYMDDETAKAVYEVFNGVYRTGEPARAFGWEMIRKDGTKSFVEASISLMHSPSGEPMGFRGIIRDITERKRAEEVLQQREQDYLALLETTFEGIIVVDAATLKVVYGNRRASKMFGFDPILKDGVGVNILDFVHPEDIGIVIKGFTEDVYQEDRRQKYEVRAKTKDGREIWIKALGTRTEFQGRIAVLLSTIDVTEQKRAEEALQQSEQRFRSLIENAQDAIVVMNSDATIRYESPSMERMTGRKVKDRIGKNLFEFCHPDDITKVTEAFLQLPENKIPIAHTELCLQHKNGSWHTFEVVGNNLLDDPVVTGIVLNLHDITERKQAEQERERLLAELEDKSKEMKQLLFVASHDLRSPLVNIQGFTREIEHSLQQVHSVLESEDIPPALKEKLAAPIEEGIADSLSYILASTSKIDTLLTGLLKLSRLGQAAIAIEKLNMSKLMAEVVDSFEFQTKEAGVKLEVAKLPQCQGDNAQINQVFSNLFGNALKYLDPERPGIIRISGRTDDSKAVYTVEDNGIGIAPEHQETVFQIFQRVDPTASSGEGLGLTIVRRILDRHGGKVWLESEPGRGSRFHVSLPIGD
jgi:PAS domain S-box-containing protein